MMGGMVFIIFLILFVLFLSGVFSLAGNRGNQSAGEKRKKQTGRANSTARQAMRRAGYAGGENYAEITDIGLLAYRQSDEPKLVRQSDVLLDTDFVRPFAEFWLPYRSRGMVRFELVDSEGRMRYADESEYDLERGKNVLLPGTWLPLRGKTIASGQWRLNVMAGGTLLAVHPFGWRNVGGGELKPYIGTDGEISPALQWALHAKAREAVSLDDLLSDQEE
jgi:hypothetical protein